MQKMTPQVFSDVERRLDGYCVMVENLSGWNIAPAHTPTEYVFRTFDDALDYGDEAVGDHIGWKIIPFFVGRRHEEKNFGNFKFCP